MCGWLTAAGFARCAARVQGLPKPLPAAAAAARRPVYAGSQAAGVRRGAAPMRRRRSAGGSKQRSGGFEMSVGQPQPQVMAAT